MTGDSDLVGKPTVVHNLTAKVPRFQDAFMFGVLDLVCPGIDILVDLTHLLFSSGVKETSSCLHYRDLHLLVSLIGTIPRMLLILKTHL